MSGKKFQGHVISGKDFKRFLAILSSITPLDSTQTSPNFRLRQATKCLICVPNLKVIDPWEGCFWLAQSYFYKTVLRRRKM